MALLHTPAIQLTDRTWRSGPILVALGFHRRLRGIRAVPPGWGVLLRGRSVHTLGLSSPLTVITLDGSGRVRRAGRVPPGRVLMDPGAVWIAELPPAGRPPGVGRLMQVLPILGGWPDH